MAGDVSPMAMFFQIPVIRIHLCFNITDFHSKQISRWIKSQHIIVDGGDADGHNRVILPRNICISAPHLRSLQNFVSFMISEKKILKKI